MCDFRMGYVTAPSPALSPLAGSPAAATSLHYSPNEISQVSNSYHNQVLAPTLNQQVLVQIDTGPAVVAEAEARHSAIMKEGNEQFREQFVRLQHEAISSASRLKLELLQAENRLQFQEEAVKAADERRGMAIKHSLEVSQLRREAMDVKIKRHQAETTVNEFVHHAERDCCQGTSSDCCRFHVRSAQPSKV